MTGSSPRPLLVCMQCGFTHAEFHAKGLLGCPACYDHFGEALFADMLHIHPQLYKSAPRIKTGEQTGDVAEDAAALHERLSDALRSEHYEEAAALRVRLDALSRARDPEPDGSRGITP